MARWNARPARHDDRLAERAWPTNCAAIGSPARRERDRQGQGRVARHVERRGVADQRSELGRHLAERRHARRRSARRWAAPVSSITSTGVERRGDAAGEIAPAQQDLLIVGRDSARPASMQPGQARARSGRARDGNVACVRDRGLDGAVRAPIGQHALDIGEAHRHDLGAERAHRRAAPSRPRGARRRRRRRARNARRSRCACRAESPSSPAR